MGYLISKIIICLFLAFLLGLMMGWLLRNQVSRSREDALITDLEGQVETIDELERDRDDIRRKLQNMERDNVDLNTKILSISSERKPYGGNPFANDFTHITDNLEQIDNDRSSTLNESDPPLSNSDQDNFHAENASTRNESHPAVEELEEVSGEWDPLTAELDLDQLATSMHGADNEAKTLGDDQISTDEEQDHIAKEAKQNSETQNLSAPDSTNPHAKIQAEPETNIYDDKTYVLDTSNNENTDDFPTDSIEIAIIEAEADHITELQNQTAPGLLEKNKKETHRVNETTLNLETVQAENLSDSLTRSGDYDIEEIEGIGKGYAQRLRNINIATTRQLLDKASSPAIITEIAHQVNKKEKVIQSWISMADLIRVPGIRGKFAEFIVTSDIKSVQQLAQQNGPELTDKIAAVHANENRSRTTPTLEMVTVWIAAAKSLPSTIKTDDW